MRRLPSGPYVSGVALVAANAVPLAGVALSRWTLASVLLGYYLEGAVVGLVTVAKIRRAEGEDDPEQLPAYVEGVSVGGRPIESYVGQPGERVARTFAGTLLVAYAFVGLFVTFVLLGLGGVSAPTVLATVGGLAASHLLSYRLDYLGDREYERTGPVTLMAGFVPHLLPIVVLALVGPLFGGVGILLWIPAKVLYDLRIHWREHAAEQPT